MPSHSKEIKLANPRGFCAGVDRAIDIVNKALEIYGSPVYVKHEVVHNKYVVEDLKNRGAIFVEGIDEIPDNSLVILVHMVSQIRLKKQQNQEIFSILMQHVL
jgi:4-hydroxy-3-methylbut-2-enyl diphosphate reductase